MSHASVKNINLVIIILITDVNQLVSERILFKSPIKCCRILIVDCVYNKWHDVYHEGIVCLPTNVCTVTNGYFKPCWLSHLNVRGYHTNTISTEFMLISALNANYIVNASKCKYHYIITIIPRQTVFAKHLVCKSCDVSFNRNCEFDKNSILFFSFSSHHSDYLIVFYCNKLLWSCLVSYSYYIW